MAEATFSIFSDADSAGWADALAALLREAGPGRVDIADSLDAAFDGDADVLIRNLDPRHCRLRERLFGEVDGSLRHRGLRR